MTQARDVLPLRLQLTPMQLPETTPVAVGKSSGSSAFSALATAQENVAGCNLLVRPGEPSEIIVKIENLSNRYLELNALVEGDFPSPWCRLRLEGSQIAPGAKMEAVLYFQIPANFFEFDESLQPQKSLQLDYQGMIYVSVNQENGIQFKEAASFNLYIRPRSLYLNFLPEIYSQVDFIGRLLAIFERTFEPAPQTLDVLWAYLDPLTAPEKMLPFLAYWVGWPAYPGLSVELQRTLIRNAMQIYRWRGTKRGLRFYLSLVLGLPLDENLRETEKHISIEEVSSKGLVMGETLLGQDSFIGGGQPYHFIVRLRPLAGGFINEHLARQIIEQEKPAFCSYELYIENRNNSS
ncbi:phage tail protein [Ancylothrix sp. C2]|uniref:phage tail protein n=1 Tax=Ancylothrix sp. D3o TaxID=2953691 RepID=UPI0021BB2C1B|nr:phage tail protein [Ancylothrix sp. D3o]MCT7948226.1 phage tail protein [Ancylothrix sp. D3o]